MTAERSPLLLTRQVAANRRFLDLLPDDLRVVLRPIETPLFHTEAVIGAPVGEDGIAAIFSSANGVRYGPPARARAAFCVGAKTAEIAKAAGWRVDLFAPTAEALIEALQHHRPTIPLVHFSGRHHRGAIAETLTEAGLKVTRSEVYDQPLLPMSTEAIAALASEPAIFIPLFSPRIASHAATFISETAPVHIPAMSDAVISALPPALQRKAHVALRPDAQAMVAALEKLVSDYRLG